MSRSFEVLKDIYKPYRYTIKGKTTILETTSGNVVVKPQEKEISKIYEYLNSRSFSSFPPLIESNREGVNVFSFVDDTDMPNEQKAQDLMNVIALLHQKTTYFKSVSTDSYQEIYESIENNITYLKNYYDTLFDVGFSEVYMSPSHYFLMRNYSKISASLNFAQKNLDDWFSLVKEETKQRVCFIHNNLSLDHYLKSDQDYLISWEKSKIDSPVLDLIHLYKSEYFDLDFGSLFQKYLEKFPWSEPEKKLFFVVISLPDKISFTNNEFFTCKTVRECLDYIYKTEELIRPYYTIENKEQ